MLTMIFKFKANFTKTKFFTNYTLVFCIIKNSTFTTLTWKCFFWLLLLLFYSWLLLIFIYHLISQLSFFLLFSCVLFCFPVLFCIFLKCFDGIIIPFCSAKRTCHRFSFLFVVLKTAHETFCMCKTTTSIFTIRQIFCLSKCVTTNTTSFILLKRSWCNFFSTTYIILFCLLSPVSRIIIWIVSSNWNSSFNLTTYSFSSF